MYTFNLIEESIMLASGRRLLISQIRKTPSIRPAAVSVSTSTRCFSTVAEQEFLVINAVGPDRVGIVSGLTEMVVDRGGNVGESQASRLGSHFGLMMLVSVPKSSSHDLQEAVQNMEGMSTSCYSTDDPNAVTASPRVGYSGHFTLSGADNPGIVNKVTKILVKHRLNIDEMKTFEEAAPYGGTTLFHMNGVATSPAPLANGFDPKLVRKELEKLGDEMNCEIDLEDMLDDKYSASFYAG